MPLTPRNLIVSDSVVFGIFRGENLQPSDLDLSRTHSQLAQCPMEAGRVP